MKDNGTFEAQTGHTEIQNPLVRSGSVAYFIPCAHGFAALAGSKESTNLRSSTNAATEH